jgi:hypothetical protein
MSNNIYNILGKLNALTPKETPESVAPQKPIYESVEARGSVLEGVAAVESRLAQMFAEEKANEDMLSKKDYDGDGEKESPRDEYKGSKDKAIKKAMDKKDLDEETHGQYLAQKEKEAQSSGKSSFQAFKQTHPVDGKPGVEEEVEEETEESLEEGFDDLQKYMADKAKGAKQGGGAGKKQGTRYGGSLQKDDEGDAEPAADNAPKKKGRPKKDKFAEDAVDEAVRGTVFGKQGYRAPETQGERDMIAKTIKGNRAQNRADTRVTGYGSRVAPQRGVDSADTGSARGSAVNVDQTGQATDFEPGIGNIDPRAQGYRGALSLGKSSQGKGVVAEKAPPGAKAERMVKHIKKGYAKDGKITPKEKSIAYATAWKAHNKNKLKEGVNFAEMMREANAEADELLTELQMEIAEFKKSGSMGDKLRDVLELHKFSKKPVVDEVVMPAMEEPMIESGAFVPGRVVYWRGKAGRVDRVEGNKCFVNKANGEMDVWPTRECSTEKQGMLDTLKGDIKGIGQGVKNFVTNKPDPMDEELNELAKLAGLAEAKKCNSTMEGKSCPVHGLKECGSMTEAKKPDYLDFDKDGDKKEPMKKALKDKEKVDECGPGTMSPMSSMGQDDGSLSINTSMNSDGTKSVSVNATGDQADALAQMLKMAGIGGHNHAEPKAVVIQAGPEEQVEEERDIEYANTPDEEVENVDAIMHQGNDLNREKEQYAGMPKAGDNPMATRESIEMPDRISRMLEGIKKVEEVYAITGRNVPSAKKGVRKTVDPATGQAKFSGGTRYYDRVDTAGHQDAAKDRADRMWQHKNPTLAKARNFAQGVGQKVGQAVDAIAKTKIAKKGTAGGF